MNIYLKPMDSLWILPFNNAYDITYYAVNQQTQAMSKRSKPHMTTSSIFSPTEKGDMGMRIPYETGHLDTAGYWDASLGINPDNGKSTSGYLSMLARGLLILPSNNVTAQSTLEAGLSSTWHSRAKRRYTSNMMTELRF